MRVDERPVARDLMPQVNIEGYLSADANYDANHPYDLATAHRIPLPAPKRYRESEDMGHYPSSLHSRARYDSLILSG